MFTIRVERALYIVVRRFLERHTQHGIDGMTVERLHIIGKIFPLIVNACSRLAVDTYIVTSLGRIAIERQACVGRASASQTITETGSKGKTFDRCEIRIDRTIDIVAPKTSPSASASTAARWKSPCWRSMAGSPRRPWWRAPWATSSYWRSLILTRSACP